MVTVSEIIQQCVEYYPNLIEVEEEIDEKLRAAIRKDPFKDKYEFFIDQPDMFKVNRLKAYYAYHGWTMMTAWEKQTGLEYKILVTIVIDNYKYLQTDIGCALNSEAKRVAEERKKDPNSRSIKVTLS